MKRRAMSESHATKQMRSAIDRAEAECNKARTVAEKIEYGLDAREDEALRDMAVAIGDLQADRPNGGRMTGAPSQPAPASHRWNIEGDESGVRICFHHHQRSEDCEWVEFVPAAPAPDALRDACETLTRVLGALDSLPDDALGRHEQTGHPFSAELRDEVMRTRASLAALTAPSAPTGEPSADEAERALDDIVLPLLNDAHAAEYERQKLAWSEATLAANGVRGEPSDAPRREPDADTCGNCQRPRHGHWGGFDGQLFCNEARTIRFASTRPAARADWISHYCDGEYHDQCEGCACACHAEASDGVES